MTKALIIIPVRLSSTRLPNKPLANILGKTMIERVYENALKVSNSDILIACDGEEIAKEVMKFKGNFIKTDPTLPSGTDRIYEAYKKYIKNTNDKYEVIINLQGDLPVFEPMIIEKLIETSLNSNCEISTLASIINNEEDVNNENIVKIAIATDKNFTQDKIGKALYFSRSRIPYNRDKKIEVNYYHHIGIYAYKPDALEKFVNSEISNLEKIEALEQLRALENGMKIDVRIIDSVPMSVDTKEDLAKVIKYLENR